MKLIIQIPAFNEEETIAETIRDLPKSVDGIESIEILVVDDGSSDATADRARSAGAHHVVRLITNRGLSTAFVAGIDAALRLGADIIVNTDADNQYRGSDIGKLIDPILNGSAEVVIGDRNVAESQHMGPFKRLLQRVGSRAVSWTSGISVPDVTSGFRAFSREAAYQINVFNPFTYTLETIIQAGNRNLGVRHVTITTNPPTRPSRLYRGIGSYVRKSIVTIFRINTIYKPLKTFFALGAIIFAGGFALGLRFLWHWLQDGSAGHVQSLILAAVLLIVGFQTMLIGLVADLISVNRRLSEEILIRIRKLERPKGRRDRATRHGKPERRTRALRPESEEPAASTETQWVWLTGDENRASTQPEVEKPEAEKGGRRRRRRRRTSQRQFIEPLPHHDKDE